MPGKFKGAFPYRESVMTLPVSDVDSASSWYSQHFAMVEVERLSSPHATVILERDGIKLGFAISGEDPSQDGAAILVSDLDAVKNELMSKGVSLGDARTDEHDGQQLNVFFVVAPDGLCYYFHEPVIVEG